MEFSRLQPDVIKFEVRQLSGQSINQSVEKNRGGFARFLSGLGRFTSAVMAPLSFVFPPAAIGAAASYGLAQTGDILQGSAMRKTMEQQGSQQGAELGNSFIPGLTQNSMDLTSDHGKVFDPLQQSRQNILATRNDLDMSAADQLMLG